MIGRTLRQTLALAIVVSGAAPSPPALAIPMTQVGTFAGAGPSAGSIDPGVNESTPFGPGESATSHVDQTFHWPNFGVEAQAAAQASASADFGLLKAAAQSTSQVWNAGVFGGNASARGFAQAAWSDDWTLSNGPGPSAEVTVLGHYNGSVSANLVGSRPNCLDSGAHGSFSVAVNGGPLFSQNVVVSTLNQFGCDDDSVSDSIGGSFELIVPLIVGIPIAFQAGLDVDAAGQASALFGGTVSIDAIVVPEGFALTSGSGELLLRDGIYIYQALLPVTVPEPRVAEMLVVSLLAWMSVAAHNRRKSCSTLNG